MTKSGTDLKIIQESILEDGCVPSDDSETDTEDESIDFKEFYGSDNDYENSDDYSSSSSEEFDYSRYNNTKEPLSMPSSSYSLENDCDYDSSDYEYDDYDSEKGSKRYREPRNSFIQSLAISKLRRMLISRDFDKRNAFHLIILGCVIMQAANLAESGYGRSINIDPRSELTRISEYEHPVFIPGSELKLRQIQDFEGIPMFEYGESHTKQVNQALNQNYVPAAGVSRFEFGEFSGIAATPEQYFKANLKQAEMQKNFWTWVKNTTPKEYYDIKVKETIVGGGESEVKGDGISSFADGGMPIPVLGGLKDVWDPLEPMDTPVFFHIPKAGGTTIKNVVGTCHRLTMATEVGVMNGHDKDTEIGVVRPYANPAEGKEGSPFVNVDTTSSEGLVRAKSMRLAESQLAELIVTPLFYEVEDIFTSTHRGRMFTIFRHPMERAMSMFYYIQVADWEASYNPLLAKMSIQEYATSPYVENNWMVRKLSNVDKAVKLSDDHLQVAMDIVRRKILVGLLSKKDESLDRFEKFFGWKFKVKPDNQELCRTVLMDQGANSNVHADLPDEGSDAYNALLFHNRWDILLYEYIEDLFMLQEAFVSHLPEGFRLLDATCAKCIPPTFPPFHSVELPVL